MKNKFRKAVLAVAITALTVPAAAWAADTTDFALAEVETEQQNLAWYADLAEDATENESCREDLPEPVFVPEYDGRVLVKAQLVAVGLTSCVDIELKSNARISGLLYAEVRNGFNDWRPFASDPVLDGMTSGIGADESMINHLFGANDPLLGKPMRVCLVTYEPDPSPPLCKTVKAASAIAIASTPTN